MHLSDGDLRRRIDEPGALAEADRRHADDCLVCRQRQTEVRADADWTARLFTAGEPAGADPALDARAALRGLDMAAAQAGAASVRTAASRWLQTGIGAIAAAAVAGLIVYGPVGSYASQLLTVFEPVQVAAVPVPQGALSALRRLRAYGDLTLPRTSIQTQASAAAAEAASGLLLALPTALPSGLAGPRFGVLASATAQFTFLAAKAHQAAQADQSRLPPMPPALDHSTLSLTVGPLAMAAYPVVGRTAAASGPSTLNALDVVVMQAPIVRSDGAGATTIENYLLSLPGIPATLASALRALQNPTETLPLPIPTGEATSSDIRLGTQPAVAIADRSGLYNAVVWEASGRIHVVGGPFTAAQVQAAAQSVQAQGH